jgi:hypothetical protein
VGHAAPRTKVAAAIASSSGLGSSESSVGLPVQADEQVLEIHMAKKEANRRHNDIVYERRYDRSECRANNHSHGEIEDIAPHHESFEVSQHSANIVSGEYVNRNPFSVRSPKKRWPHRQLDFAS